MSKLHTDAPHNLNINQVTSDVIILYNDDGTKVIMVNENGQWLQARWLQARTDSTQKNEPQKTYEIESQTIVSQPHPKAYKKDESPSWYIDIEDAQDLSTIGGEHYVIVKDDYIIIRDDQRFGVKR